MTNALGSHLYNSPLKAQADGIAKILAAFERGEMVDPVFADKIKQARGKDVVKVGIIMDDHVITLDIPWTIIHSTGEVAMAEYILKLMRGQRDTH